MKIVQFFLLTLGVTIWLGLAGAGVSYASTSVFDVKNVEVDISGESTVNARDKAFAKARRMAFERLAERLLTEDEIKALPQPDDAEISVLINNFEIVHENLAPNRYVGEFSFSFKENATRQFFEGGGYRFSDIGGKAILVLPYFQEGGPARLWSGENPWLEAWQRVDTYSEGLVPVMVPLGDVQDLSSAPESTPLNYDQDALLNMAERYKAEAVVIAIATLNTETELSIDLYRTDGFAPAHIKSFKASVPENEQGEMDIKQIMRNEVREVYAFMQRNWREQTATSAYAQKSSISVFVPFSDLGEWVRIRNALDNVAAISEYDVASLDQNGADVKLNYSGSYERLMLALGQQALYIEQPNIQAGYDASGSYYAMQAAGQKPILRKQ